MKAICNTTPVIALASVNRIELLRDVFGKIAVPEAVIDEIDVGGAITVPDIRSFHWIEVVPNIPDDAQKLLYQLDYGERNVILNALKLKVEMVLIDDRVARNIAEYLGLRVKGTLGVLVDAKRKGIIHSFKELALEMRENGIRFSLRLIEEIASALDEKLI